MYQNMSNITQKWVNLLFPFSNNYLLRVTASELAKITKIPQQTASRYLNELVKQNLMSYEKQGKNKLFYFDLEKESTKILLNLIEINKSLKFQSKIQTASVIINQILKNCESLIVFGSYASYDFTKNSDLDVVILGKCNKKQIKKIKQKQIIEINEHYVSYSEFNKILKSRNALSLEILNNHILFGNISKIVEIFWKRENERR
tara:strand:- start:3531 stop:4139 length:609 start_codon:yes stop_codon:yes gene_type:complete